MTGPRQAVLGVLAARRDHLNAEQIFDLVTDESPTVARSTVYRALEALSNMGVVTHVHTGHGPTVYHLAAAHADHLHLECGRCGRLLDVPDDLLDDVASRLVADFDFALDADHTALAGVCDRCR